MAHDFLTRLRGAPTAAARQPMAPPPAWPRQPRAPGRQVATTGAGAAPVPHCEPMPADRVVGLLAELRAAIARLADAEGWPAAHRARVLGTTAYQPAATLAGDLAHFRARRAALAARATPGAPATTRQTCSTCTHRAEHSYGVPVRCARAPALTWQHHDWLDAPAEPNDCNHFERKRR